MISTTKESSASNCTNYQHQASKVLKLSTLLNISRDGQTSGKLGKNFLVNTIQRKSSGTAATSSAAPGSASTAPDGLGLAFGGYSDWLVQITGFSSGGEPMGKYKKLERFLAPAINQPKALKIKLFASMLSSSRKQHMNHSYQENFNVGLACTSVS